MAELANCDRCDALFVKTVRNICKSCFDEEEKAFKIVRDFLRVKRNREATVTEVVEETGVSGKQITAFIKEKRLLTSQFPKLAYACEKCGANITAGKICSACSKALLQDLADESRKEERRLEVKEKQHSTIYYSLGEKKE